MIQYVIFMSLIAIIILVGVTLRKIPIPPPLVLVVVGMLLSFLPYFSTVKLNPEVVMNIFLPFLVYEATAYLSWPDVKINKRPIALLSIGHVIFITVLVAIVAHFLIPDLSWPLAFVLGSVIAPPDDVAIIAIAEKVKMPYRIVTVLIGEGLLNDATALTIFRFSLAVVITHTFSASHMLINFILVIIGETLYGILLGHLLGQIRLRIPEPNLHILMSLLTPFLAYLPAVKLGGSGVLATVVTGFVLAHSYAERFTPDVRLLWTAIWKTLGFTLSSILFLGVGLHFRNTLNQISFLSIQQLWIYAVIITLVVIIGRFFWVYPIVYLPRILFPSILKKDPYPPWQYPFIISWAGMRGGISLAAALSIPYLPATAGHFDLRYLIIFLVFSVIIGTLLVQGLTLTWLLKVLGVDKMGHGETVNEHINELSARSQMANAVLDWLIAYKLQIKNDPILLEQVNYQIQEYQALTKHLRNIVNHYDPLYHLKPFSKRKVATVLFAQIIEIERDVLIQLWRKGSISFKTKNKLREKLDLRASRFSRS